MPTAPPPKHILRLHSAQLAALSFSKDNERLYSGDIQGLVVATSTRTMRAIASWKAHSDGILGVEEWQDYVITHGRDNKLHLWARPEEATTMVDAATTTALSAPNLLKSMDVNALNFCRFSLAAHPGANDALVALPNLIDSSVADVWSLPSGDRLHAAIGSNPDHHGHARGAESEEHGRGDTGIIMSLHLYQRNGLQLVTAFESGTVALRANVSDGSPTVNGQGWQLVWQTKLHLESVMGMAAARDNSFAITVSVDHLIGRYSLNANSTDNPAKAFGTKHAGNAAVSIRPDGRICAVAGWDGKIRLYSTKSFKSLGTLVYHREGCFCVAFANDIDYATSMPEDPGNPLAMTVDEVVQRSRWLAAGSKDSRVTVWNLIDLDGADARPATG